MIFVNSARDNPVLDDMILLNLYWDAGIPR